MDSVKTPGFWFLLLMIWLRWCTIACGERHVQLESPMAVFHNAHSQDQQFKRHVFMVIIVTSPAQLLQRRGWQRKQWQRSLELLSANSSALTFEFVYRFCIGNHDLSHSQMSQLEDEQRQFGDLQLVDSLDYDNEPTVLWFKCRSCRSRLDAATIS